MQEIIIDCMNSVEKMPKCELVVQARFKYGPPGNTEGVGMITVDLDIADYHASLTWTASELATTMRTHPEKRVAETAGRVLPCLEDLRDVVAG